MKKRLKYILLGMTAVIVDVAPLSVSVNDCTHMFNETKVPDCLK